MLALGHVRVSGHRIHRLQRTCRVGYNVALAQYAPAASVFPACDASAAPPTCVSRQHSPVDRYRPVGDAVTTRPNAARLNDCSYQVRIGLQAPSAGELTHDTGAVLADVKLPATHASTLLSSDHMRMLAAKHDVPYTKGSPSPCAPTLALEAPGLQLPPLLPADSPALSSWISEADDLLRSIGMHADVCSHAEGDNVVSASGSTNASKSQRAKEGMSAAAVSLARVQQAASVACGHHRAGSALPDADTFVLLMFALHGGSVEQLPPALASVAAAPVGRFVWPAYAAAMHGPAPLLQLVASARILLAREDMSLFSALEGAHLVNEVLLHWLQELLLPVLTVPAASAVVALTLVHGPLVLAAVAVALLRVLRAVALQKAVAESSDELREWLLAVHCFDVDAPELLKHTLAIEARHRHTLLPMLLNPSGSGFPDHAEPALPR